MTAPSPAPRRAERRDFLIELGTEELPPKALRTLELAFAEELRARTHQAALRFGEVESFATPRRLAVLLRRLASHQPDQRIVRRGPSLRASFDAAGVPTRAGLAFAQSVGVTLETLGTERDDKGNEYLRFEGLKQGAAAVSLLPALVQQSLEALPIPRRMRWGESEALFVRPVHWLLMLYGSELVPASILGLHAGTSSFGHRFMAPGPLRIASPGTYERLLQRRGKVLAGFEMRRNTIRAQVEAFAAQLEGRALIAEALLEEVTALVEWPVAIAGQFEARFLRLPREVLIAVLQHHQRYFALEDNAGNLLPRFITISNVESPNPELIRAGNERVVRPRLADAEFFWQQDRRQSLAARLTDLAAVTFQAQLGSQAQRTARIEALAAAIAASIGADVAASRRAALLCKCDLLTAMVGEFPELQGVMGRYYALADGEAGAVAEAIREHYLPRGAGDALPASALGDALALADKLDTLAGIFAIGHKPSGTRDPFGLRRAAIGVVRIVLEHRLELDLVALLEHAAALQPVANANPRAADSAMEIYDFLLERLRAQYLERAADNGVTTELFDAVLATRPRSLLDFDARLSALARFIARPEGLSLAAANKRIANILRKSADSVNQNVDPQRLREEPERALHGALEALRARVLAATAERQYAGALELLATLKPAVDHFFDRVMVNDPDHSLRDNRVALLLQLRTLFGGIADLSRLPG
ncbi:MAG: glycine--tRNA ligase subunit beta [Steroidobacteraceae bacterium]|jgi:glycyl-tRNA synthetase beta chain